MTRVNENYAKLPGSYLFSGIVKKVAAFQAAHPETEIIRLGIGDVTQPLAPAILKAMHQAVDEMGHAETFRGYAPEQGYLFLRDVIAREEAAIFQRTRSLSPTEPSATPEISRSCFLLTAWRRSAIRCIRSIWIPMLWRAAPDSIMRIRENLTGWSICPVRRRTAFFRSFRRNRRI